MALPRPVLSTDILNYNPFLGKVATLCLTPSNSGDQNGFRPVIEIVVPVNLTFQGATFLELPVEYDSYLIPSSGGLTYNIGRYSRTVTGQPGAEVVVLMPPINNIPAGERIPPICVDLLVTDDAVIGKDHLVNSTLIFAYGTDPLDNPSVDPPEVSYPLQVTVTPSLIRVRKGLSGIWSADVVPTGPNYAFNYTIIVSMAGVEFARAARYGGGDFNPPFGRGRTWGYIKFWAYVEEEYSSTVPSGDQEIDSGDVLSNEVTMTSEYSGTSTVPPDIGRTTSLTIKRPWIEKRIAYLNGASPPSPVYVKAGDTVTYELKVYISTANADELEIKDMIPLPVFRVDYNRYGQTPLHGWSAPDDHDTTASGAVGHRQRGQRDLRHGDTAYPICG